MAIKTKLDNNHLMFLEVKCLQLIYSYHSLFHYSQSVLILKVNVIGIFGDFTHTRQPCKRDY